jgi:hypothetical protein
MGGFTFRLELVDGTPADPPTLKTAVPNWQTVTRARWGERRFALSPFETTTQINVRRWLLRTVPNSH